jgi:hypothetical protein
VQKLFWIIFSLLIVTSTAWSQDIGRVEIVFPMAGHLVMALAEKQLYSHPMEIFMTGLILKTPSWGFAGEYFITPNIEVGFMFNRQKSTLELGGSTTREIGDLNVDNYDGTFSYNMGSVDSHSRPFFMLGLGATHYGAVDFTFNGVPHTIDGNTKASVTFGGGLKFYASRNFGVRLQARLTPTYINTDEDGWWCDPFWGCYTVGNVQYSNQIEMSGGINFRF